MTTALPRPDAAEHAAFYARYIALVPDGDIVARLRAQGDELANALASVSEVRGGFRYAKGKWTIREVVGHLIDAERIFSYRALRIARGDATPLAGFDENAYVPESGADARPLADLVAELRAVRESTGRLFASLPSAAWTRTGTASGQPVSVRALAWITAGHAAHHLGLLRERYGV